jgi:uncharacterized protein (DUF885 family)
VRAPGTLDERKEALLARMMAIPEYLEGARLNLQRSTIPALEAANELCLGGPEFLDGVVRMLLRAYPDEAERIEHAGERARVGLFQYQEFLDRELRPRGVAPFALGERWMNYRLAHEHLLATDCPAVAERARQRMAELERALEREAARIDPAQSWREQIDAARRRHPEPLRLMETYDSELRRVQSFASERLDFALPTSPLEMIETPEYLRGDVPYAATLTCAPLDATSGGALMVTPVDLGHASEAQDVQLGGHDEITLSLRIAREAWPGRHLQAAMARNASSRIRRIAASALTQEGWALVAEELAVKAGLVEDPRVRLFQWRDQLESACLAAVDVGLHTSRLSLPEAATLLATRAHISAPEARELARHCACHPSHGLCAMTGFDLLNELRDEWNEDARGGSAPAQGSAPATAFDQAVLGVGMLPPFLVREALHEITPG